MAAQRYDVVVIGAGPGGEVVASRVAPHGLKVALIEQELVGGECAYWACIPSKTLLRPPEVRSEAARAPGTSIPENRFADVAAYRDYMVRHLDDSGQVKEYEDDGIDVFRGRGKIAGPGHVEVADRTLETDRIVVATGSETRIPEIPGLREAGYWTNREATTISEVPESVVVLGGGPVGIELAQMLRRFGSGVELIESADRLLGREDERVGELLAQSLDEDGISVRLGAEVESVERSSGRRTAVLKGGGAVSGQELIVASGRTPRVSGLGLETVGIEPGRGGIEIDDRCRAAEGVWAIGDCTGAMPFTHVAMYHGRVVSAQLQGDDDARVELSGVPRVVFSDPEVAAVGLTEAQAAEQGIDTAVSHVELGKTITRPSTYEEDSRGELTVIADRRRRVLVGAWAVAPLSGEWIHYAALAIRAQIPIDVVRDSVAQFPTYTEAYYKALEQLS